MKNLQPFFENDIGVYFEYRDDENNLFVTIPLSEFICSYDHDLKAMDFLKRIDAHDKITY